MSPIVGTFFVPFFLVLWPEDAAQCFEHMLQFKLRYKSWK